MFLCLRPVLMMSTNITRRSTSREVRYGDPRLQVYEDELWMEFLRPLCFHQ